MWCSSSVMLGCCRTLSGQGRLHGSAGGVGGMDDAAVAVAAFAGQVVASGSVVAGEWHALLDQPFDRGPAVFDDETGGVASHSPAPAIRVSWMWASIESSPSSTAAMPPWAQRWRHPAVRLGDQRHSLAFGQLQRQRLPARPLPMMITSN